MSETKYKCPTCNGTMWMDYDSWMGGKDYKYKCSKKKHHNPSCPDKTWYWECDKCEKPVARVGKKGAHQKILDHRDICGSRGVWIKQVIQSKKNK